MQDKTKNRQIGNIGEDAAANYLEDKGFAIIDRNLTLDFGEIDILAQENDTIVIVEVKTVRGGGFGPAQELVRSAKQNKLRLLARAIEQRYPSSPIRIDVIAVNLAFSDTRIEHIINAVY